MTPTLSVREILDALSRDRETGFRMLLSYYKEPVYWHIRRITVVHHDAEDALQETFLRVFRNLAKCNTEMPLTAWIFRIATNEAIRQRGKNRDFPFPPDDETGQEIEKIPADEYFDYSDLETVKLQKAILSLPPKQQLAFNLRYYDEFDYATIAQITDSTATNVKANYHAAKEKIIRYMNSHD
ncbi:MAG: RNA polymerase sigma factor [Duncaniella sp.]|uniref:RNA polymerase sigma factor n=1 Tax=Duncaniella sp. TaxID=2518496 RepID=UPI0023CC51E6|nr:RNA polymerase sigma factor [Duncaniella sp.]MDE5989832.1 RNA polymerase sigma factor [Duncaniella sp.]